MANFHKLHGLLICQQFCKMGPKIGVPVGAQGLLRYKYKLCFSAFYPDQLHLPNDQLHALTRRFK